MVFKLTVSIQQSMRGKQASKHICLFPENLHLSWNRIFQNMIRASQGIKAGALACSSAHSLFQMVSLQFVVIFGGHWDTSTKEPNVLAASLPPKSDQPKLPVTFPRSVSREPPLETESDKEIWTSIFHGFAPRNVYWRDTKNKPSYWSGSWEVDKHG